MVTGLTEEPEARPTVAISLSIVMAVALTLMVAWPDKDPEVPVAVILPLWWSEEASLAAVVQAGGRPI